MNIRKDIKRLITFLSKNKKKLSPLLILTHNYPDPDAVASAFTLQYIARKFFNIDSRISYGGIISKFENQYMIDILEIPCWQVRQRDFKKYTHVALVDTQPGFGNNVFPAEKRATIVIDQHVGTTKPAADLVIIDTKCGATCEILAQALLSLKGAIPPNIATALVHGLLSDTLNLYRVRRRDIFKTYFKLLTYCDMRLLIRIQNAPRPAELYAAMRKGIQNARVRGKLIVSHLQYVKDPVFVAHIADFLLRYDDMQWSFCTGRYNDNIYVSLRTADTTISAPDILRDVILDKTHSGGHGTMAGGSIAVDSDASGNIWRRKERALTQRLIKRLNIPISKSIQRPFTGKTR